MGLGSRVQGILSHYSFPQGYHDGRVLASFQACTRVRVSKRIMLGMLLECCWFGLSAAVERGVAKSDARAL